MTIGQASSFLPDYSKAKHAAALIFKVLETIPGIDIYSSRGTYMVCILLTPVLSLSWLKLFSVYTCTLVLQCCQPLQNNRPSHRIVSVTSLNVSGINSVIQRTRPYKLKITNLYGYVFIMINIFLYESVLEKSHFKSHFFFQFMGFLM